LPIKGPRINFAPRAKAARKTYAKRGEANDCTRIRPRHGPIASVIAVNPQ
jgi:hypothetical protein